MSNSLDPDQAQRFVMPDLGPNCLQSFSADDKSQERVKSAATFWNTWSWSVVCSGLSVRMLKSCFFLVFTEIRSDTSFKSKTNWMKCKTLFSEISHICCCWFVVLLPFQHYLMLSTLGKIFSRWHFEIFFLFFPENRIQHLMQIVS